MPDPQQQAAAPAPNIFDTLAQHDTQLAQHDQMATQAVQPNIFDTLAKNNGEMPAAGTQDNRPTIGPRQSTSSQLNPETATDPFQRAGRQMTGGFARLLMDATDKLREIEHFSEEGKEEHPVQAFMGHIANKLEGLTFGNEGQGGPNVIGTGKYGLLNNPVTSSLIPGAEGEPALAAALRGGASLVKGAYQAGKSALGIGEAAEEAPGIVKQVLKGKEAAQEPAKAAIRGTVGADEDTTLLEGHKSVVDEHLQGIATKEKAAYQKMDKAAGFDVKETRASLRDAEYKVKQPEIDDATRDRLNMKIREMKSEISDAEKKMTESGIDPKEADTLHKQRMAGMEFKKVLVRNLSEDGQSVNVDGLLKASKNLRNMSKYGDRLEQYLGKDGADQFMQKLREASDMGAHAMKVQQVAKWIGGIAGVGAIGETARHLVQ